MSDFAFKSSAETFLTGDKNTVFYPGAGGDVHDVAIFADHGISRFVHADYLEAPDLSDALEENHFSVLHAQQLTFRDLIDIGNFSESERFNAVNWQAFANADTVRNGVSRCYVFKSGRNILTLLQIFGEAHWVYEQVFAKRNRAAFGVLLQDHGMGGGWTQFGGHSTLYTMAQSHLPEWLVVGENTQAWPGYGGDRPAGNGGQHQVERVLWRLGQRRG